MANLGERLRPTKIGNKLIITEHKVDSKYIGITLPRPAEQKIKISDDIFIKYDKEIFCPKDYYIVFNTVEGEVEYLLQTFSEIDQIYYCVLVEDRRNVR